VVFFGRVPLKSLKLFILFIRYVLAERIERLVYMY
jgi:hypothetical protein